MDTIIACDECRYSRYCHNRTRMPKNGNPEDCSEYWMLEDLWWDAWNDREPEEDDSDDDYEDEEEY